MPPTVSISGTVSLKCPACDARIRAPRQLLGSERPCPRCRHKLVIHVPLPSDSDIHLIVDDSVRARLA